jgi:aminopeptidase-like protein
MGICPLLESVDGLERLLHALEVAGKFRNLFPYGEPQLGKRGLYPNLNSSQTQSHSTDVRVDNRTALNRILMILNYSDGEHSMLEIAERCGCDVFELQPIVEQLEKANLLAHDYPKAVTS